MGYYIETEKAKGKAKDICDQHGAKIVSEFDALSGLEDGEGIVCVVDNGPFEAAAFIYSQQEFNEFSSTMDGRPKIWLTMDRTKAEELSGYSR